MDLDEIFNLVLAFVVAAIITALAVSVAGDKWQNEAVKHGAAEFYLDRNNARQWRWLK